MRKNEMILRYGLILIGIILLGCLIFTYQTQLRHPVFLKHYIDRPISEEGDSLGGNTLQDDIIRLQYITNITDSRDIVSVTFDEYPEIQLIPQGKMYWETNSLNNQNKNYTEEKHGRYSVRTIGVAFNFSNLDELTKDIILSNAVVNYNNGDTQRVDIGKILLYKEDEASHDGITILSSNTSDKTSTVCCMLEENILFESFNPSFMNIIDKNYTISINSRDWKDVQEAAYKSCEILTIDTVYKKPQNLLHELISVDTTLRCYYKDSEGKLCYSDLLPINTQCNFTYWMIIQYLKARGEL